MLAALLAVVVVAEVAVRLVAPELPEETVWYHEVAQAKTEQIAEQPGDLDIVFAGTSQSYHGIDPAVIDERLGTRSYNAGVPAGIPSVQRRWLSDAVLDDLEPDTVVWALSSVDMNAARPQQMDPVYESAFATRTGALAEADRWLADRFALFRHRRTITEPRSWFTDDDPVDEARSALLPNGKRTPGSTNVSEQERRRISRDVIGDYEVGGAMSAAIRETARDLQERDLDVIFVWLPEAPRYVDLLPDASLQAEARAEAAALAGEVGARFVDVSGGYDDDDFIDFTHLDGDAAERLSSRLASHLIDRR